MRIGQAARIDSIGVDDWADFAEAAGYRKAYVLERVQSLAGKVLACLPEAGDGILEQGGDPSRVERVMVAIAGNTRKVGLGRLASETKIKSRRGRVAPTYAPGSATHRCTRCRGRSEEHTSELQSLMRISYAVFCLKK